MVVFARNCAWDAPWLHGLRHQLLPPASLCRLAQESDEEYIEVHGVVIEGREPACPGTTAQPSVLPPPELPVLATAHPGPSAVVAIAGDSAPTDAEPPGTSAPPAVEPPVSPANAEPPGTAASQAVDGPAAGRQRRAEEFGPWSLAPVYRGSECIGWGATCKHHWDAGSSTECKKQLAFGRSQMTVAECQQRLKTWLLKGTDSSIRKCIYTYCMYSKVVFQRVGRALGPSWCWVLVGAPPADVQISSVAVHVSMGASWARVGSGQLQIGTPFAVQISTLSGR